MTREEAKEAAKVLTAYAEGKDIEYRGDKSWKTFYGDTKDSTLVFNFTIYSYRIKQEPKYRPFKNREECWTEMQKHQPFMWVEERNDAFTSIDKISDIDVHTNNYTYFYNESFKELKFADGTPFGIRED